jgi:C4-dicarboxylate-specific signal transduction histidine kinase
MNTLTPVTSLAETATVMLDDESAKDDIREAVTTIARRSEGLMNFVLRYRELLRIPQPDPGNVGIKSALESVATLMSANLAGVDISVDVVPESLAINADSALLDQVLVNLVKNALEAMSDMPEPRLRLTGRLEYGHVLISVCDNGPGIDNESLDQVFVPFFTTKREGSGIGLSLCRQIMTAHGGDIIVASGKDGTTFSLIF